MIVIEPTAVFEERQQRKSDGELSAPNSEPQPIVADHLETDPLDDLTEPIMSVMRNWGLPMRITAIANAVVYRARYASRDLREAAKVDVLKATGRLIQARRLLRVNRFMAKIAPADAALFDFVIDEAALKNLPAPQL